MATCPTCLNVYPDGQQTCPADGERLLPDEACKGFDEDLAQGTVVGEYVIEEKIGEGGFGRVFRATHPVIGKQAAIKVLNREYSSNPNVVSRFVSEARAVNQIRHRNIIDIFSFGALEDGRQYLVMEFLDGMTFDAYLREHGRIRPEEAVPLFRALAKALDAAHAGGIAHRDLKPENIFLVVDDEGGVFPKLLDFGIAKLMGDDNVNHKTRTGAAMGTPLYMSPEQCRGRGVDHRTDIYSFGIMVHEALTGRLPFDGESMMDLMFKHAKEPPPPMSEVCPAIPKAMDAPVLAMLEKDPAARPASLVAAVDALGDAARSVGLPVPSAKKSTTGESITLSRSKLGSSALESAATVVDATASGGASNAGAGTLDTVASDVQPTGGGGKTALLVAAALVVGVGVTLAVTSGGGSSDATPAATTEPTGETAGETSGETSGAATSEPTAEPSPTTSATAQPSTAVAAPPSPPAPTAAPPTPVPVAPPKPPPAVPPPVKPPPPPPAIPDDLENF